MLILFGIILIFLLVANVFLLGVNFYDVRCADVQTQYFSSADRCTPKNLTVYEEGLVYTTALSSLQYQEAESYQCPTPVEDTLDKYGLYADALQELLQNTSSGTVPTSENRMLSMDCGKFCTDSKFDCDDTCDKDFKILNAKARSISFEKPEGYSVNLIAFFENYLGTTDEKLSINCLQFAKTNQVGLWGLDGFNSCVLCTLLDVERNEKIQIHPNAVNKFCQNEGAPMSQMTAPFVTRSTSEPVLPEQMRSNPLSYYEPDYYGLCLQELLSKERSPAKSSLNQSATLPKFFASDLITSTSTACSAGDSCDFYTPCPSFSEQNLFSCQSAWVNSFSDLLHSRSFADVWFQDYIQTLTKFPDVATDLSSVNDLFQFDPLFSTCLKLMQINLEKHGWSTQRKDHPCFKHEGVLAVASVCSTYASEFIDFFNQVGFDDKPQPLHCGHKANGEQDKTDDFPCSVYRNSMRCNGASENNHVCRFVRGECVETELQCPSSAVDRQFTDPLPPFRFWSLSQFPV